MKEQEVNNYEHNIYVHIVLLLGSIFLSVSTHYVHLECRFFLQNSNVPNKQFILHLDRLDNILLLFSKMYTLLLELYAYKVFYFLSLF